MENRKLVSLENKIDADKLYGKGMYREALKLYMNAIDLDPLQVGIYFNIVKTYIKLNEDKNASLYLEKALKIASPDEVIKYRKGISGVFFLAKKYELAFSSFHPIITIDASFDESMTFVKYAISAGKVLNVEKFLESRNAIAAELIEGVIRDNEIPSEQKKLYFETQKQSVENIKMGLVKELLPLSQFLNDNSSLYEKIPESKSWMKSFAKLNESHEPDEIFKLRAALNASAKDIKLMVIALLRSNHEEDLKLLKERIEFAMAFFYELDPSLKESVLAVGTTLQDFNQEIATKDYLKLSKAFSKLDGLMAQSEDVQTKCLLTISNLINEEIKDKQWGSAISISNKLLNHFPGDSSFQETNAFIKQKKGSRSRKVVIISAVLLVALIIITVVSKRLYENKEWNKTLAENSIDGYLNYLGKNPEGRFSGLAQEKLELAYWQSALVSNTSSSYTDFILRYPESSYSSLAIAKEDTAAWKEAKSSDDLVSLTAYLDNHPAGSFRDSASFAIIEFQWNETKDRNEVSSYYDYINRYPDSDHAQEAIMKMNSLVTKKRYEYYDGDAEYDGKVEFAVPWDSDKIEDYTGIYYYELTDPFDQFHWSVPNSHWSVMISASGGELHGTVKGSNFLTRSLSSENFAMTSFTLRSVSPSIFEANFEKETILGRNSDYSFAYYSKAYFGFYSWLSSSNHHGFFIFGSFQDFDQFWGRLSKDVPSSIAWRQDNKPLTKEFIDNWNKYW